jgi:hypothetical protein
MSPALLLGIALALAPAPQRAAAEEPAPRLADRAPVAGMQALLCVSTLVYEGHPDLPHELFALYAFPDRAKWQRSLVGSTLDERVIDYRSGDACWRIERGRSTAERLEGRERDLQVLRMELRRALLLWPDGFAWSRAAGIARVELGALGHLEAALGPDGAPARLASFDAAGAPCEAFDEIAWQELLGRRFPKSVRLSAGGAPVWRETFEQVSTGVRVLDHCFLPADSKPELPSSGVRREGGAGVELALAPRTVLRVPLEAELEWPAVLARAADLRRGARSTLAEGVALAPGFEIELTPGGRPVAVLLSLARPPGAPGELPEGWLALPGERVLEARLGAFPTAGAGGVAGVVALLSAELPRAAAGPPRAWLDPAGPPAAGSAELRVRIPIEALR